MGTIAVLIFGLWVLLPLMFCLALGLTAHKPVPNLFASPDRVQSRSTSAATAGKEAPGPWETSP